ncbi:MAG: hypothetical protein IPG48_06985 [Saprospiraceae bacterium]|nr:hypothetical protein [Saprospiraceae bacterium]
MNRKDFLKTCGFACLGGSAIVTLMQSCTVTKTISGNIENSDLMVAISDFESVSDDKIIFKKYVIINNDVLKFPICVYRIEENKYNALWLECTHQEMKYRCLVISSNARRMAVNSVIPVGNQWASRQESSNFSCHN